MKSSLMRHHRRAASWAAVPSGPMGSPVSSSSNLSNKTAIGPSPQASLSTDTHSSTPTQRIIESRSDSSLLTKSIFSLPSVCLFSRKALSDEYSEEKDIVPFISPVAALDCVTMLIGVLESLMAIVNEMPTAEDDDEDEDEEFDHDKRSINIDDDNEDDSGSLTEDNPFVILGLSTCKVCIWTAMGDYLVDGVRQKDDLCLDATVEQIGEYLVLLVQCWFNNLDDPDGAASLCPDEDRILLTEY
ncbi:hypothetical protein EC973_000966 [Apophysomyces ossiformis]|uniref:Uncharacterized protein n=1 Tax=Apophysomyces ossiformis TaxID=679940 RepID=A0A8H7ES80_9FUNG|nr:hypothetical protein EC973_000966 [Apophysomyces ossiformis]